jgi:signal transduction histidine kinase
VVHGAVRLTFPTAEVDRRIARNWWLLAVVAGVVLAATAVVGWTIARWVTRPTRKVERAAATVAGGDLTARAPTDEGPPEVRELARGFNRMAQRLDTLMRAQRDFVADASHQLRSPLTALRLEIEDLPVRVDGAEGRERALAETQRLGRLVDGLLVLARPGTDQRPSQPTDVAPVVAARLAVWRPLADESAVGLTMDGASAATASAVPDHLEQILDNLIANALEVSPSQAAVRVTVEADPAQVRIRVRDQGPGMTAEQRARAFDRFWRGPEAEAGTGSGLGLAIARELARASGGDIELDAAPGSGLDATIVLPVAG